MLLLMAWINEKYNYIFSKKLCIFILKKDVIPNRVTVIMDDHKFGFKKLAKILKWCRDINIKEVSVFAFSINNFKRDIDEVTYLMNMVREKFQRLIDEMLF